MFDGDILKVPSIRSVGCMPVAEVHHPLNRVLLFIKDWGVKNWGVLIPKSLYEGGSHILKSSEQGSDGETESAPVLITLLVVVISETGVKTGISFVVEPSNRVTSFFWSWI